MIEFCKKRGMENISASSHASIKSAWSFVDAVDVVVLQQDSELIRSAYMHGLILDPVNFGAVEWAFTSMGRIKTFLRNRTSDQRLNDLTVLFVNNLQLYASLYISFRNSLGCGCCGGPSHL